MNNAVLDEILNKISLVFSNESLELVIPKDTMIELSMYRVGNIDTNDLESEMAFQSKIYTLFSALLSYVSDGSSRVNALIKRIEATKALEYEKQLVATGERATDKKIDKLVESDEEYQTAVSQSLDYENMVKSFQNVLKSLEMKRDMLLQLSIKRRQENSV